MKFTFLAKLLVVAILVSVAGAIFLPAKKLTPIRVGMVVKSAQNADKMTKAHDVPASPWVTMVQDRTHDGAYQLYDPEIRYAENPREIYLMNVPRPDFVKLVTPTNCEKLFVRYSVLVPGSNASLGAEYKVKIERNFEATDNFDGVDFSGSREYWCGGKNGAKGKALIVHFTSREKSSVTPIRQHLPKRADGSVEISCWTPEMDHAEATGTLSGSACIPQDRNQMILDTINSRNSALPMMKMRLKQKGQRGVLSRVADWLFWDTAFEVSGEYVRFNRMFGDIRTPIERIEDKGFVPEGTARLYLEGKK